MNSGELPTERGGRERGTTSATTVCGSPEEHLAIDLQTCSSYSCEAARRLWHHCGASPCRDASLRAALCRLRAQRRCHHVKFSRNSSASSFIEADVAFRNERATTFERRFDDH